MSKSVKYAEMDTAGKIHIEFDEQPRNGESVHYRVYYDLFEEAAVMECIQCSLSPNKSNVSFQTLKGMKEHMEVHRQAGDFVPTTFDEFIDSSLKFQKVLRKRGKRKPTN